MKEKVILHCDLNSFYASVECLYHPEVKGKPVAVGGDPKKRHGIILTKNQEAKKYNIQVGEALWQAKRKCPDLIIFPPRFELYQRYSELTREIFQDYTDRIEPFGLDEAWLDVTESSRLFGSGKEIADQLRKRIFEELGVTASVGVSWNKIYAKLGSDYKKPDATTVIDRNNYTSIVFPLNANELLYVGNQTCKKLLDIGIKTIGDLANASPALLKQTFGKNGLMLHEFANGNVDDPVEMVSHVNPIKFIGNSTTCPKDICNMEELKIVAYVLAESVGARLREAQMEGEIITVYLRDSHLLCTHRRRKISYFTSIDEEILQEALLLFQKYAPDMFPLRSIGISVSGLRRENNLSQLSFFNDFYNRAKEKKLEKTMDEIRQKYGHDSICRLVTKVDDVLSGCNPKDEHTIHPKGLL